MWPFSGKKKRIYLDYAAATPMRREVLKAMQPFFVGSWANPSAIHAEGIAARAAVEAAREKIARTLRVRTADIIFTSGGTESNHLALRGVVAAMLESGVRVEDMEIISLATEHPSISKTLEDLQKEGVLVTYAPIDESGRVVIEEFEKLLSPKTRIVSIAYANSETGVVQDIGKISRAIKAFEKENNLTVLFHTDASQAPLWLPCALDSLGVDLMTLDAGKCEGPKGVGVLVKRPRAKIKATTQGGSQENGLRPGTEPVALIVGASVAIELAANEQEAKAKKVARLRDRWLKELLEIKGVVLNGSADHRLPNNVNISIPGFDSEFAVVTLDRTGVAASTKSACAGANSGRSNVVFAMTHDEERASSTIRFTLGPKTTKRELQEVTMLLKNHLEKMSKFAFDRR